MKENLVIVESPAKAKTIEKFLGDKYKVLSSYGHIRDLKRKSFSVDEKTFEPQYEVPADKVKVVAQLKTQAEQARMVWLASDEDREGEAISWHLYEVLGLKPENTRRIVFHEITKPAILEAIEHPRQIDLNLVNAQQARRVLDRIVGFKLSPVLWRKVKPSLSAGRVQSVAVRLIVEREREIEDFHCEENYRVTALFQSADGSEVKAELSRRFPSSEEAKAFLESIKDSSFTVQDIATKPLRRTPAPPFTTSTLQQEAAHKLGFTVAQTMMVAQHLYESGRITYMRTDSVNLSQLCLNASKKVITGQMGKEYVKTRQYHTNSKGAQEAHEAIRPTYIENSQIEGNQQERRLYDLIWKRTIASQMADAELERTQVTISIEGREETFLADGEVIKFDGFLRVYAETNSDALHEGEADNENLSTLPAMTVGEQLMRQQAVATQRFSQRPVRYNEASLVRKLEELGIGRPSTYAPTISTIQQREYVQKGDKKGVERTYTIDTLQGDRINTTNKKEVVGNEKGKLLPSDIGIVVNDFLLKYFPDIMDYGFTANVEKHFDKIAEGKAKWSTMIKKFYKEFDPVVERTMNIRAEHKAGERELGIDPKTGRPVFVKIGRFGPIVQIGTAEDTEKPLFSQLPSNLGMETITLEEALELFKLPRTIGEYEGSPVVIGSGRYGPYIMHDKKYVSLPKTEDPLTVQLDRAIELIDEKRQQEANRHLQQFDEDPKMEVMNGRYGAYICYDGKNYRMPKTMQNKAGKLTYEECINLVNSAANKKK